MRFKPLSFRLWTVFIITGVALTGFAGEEMKLEKRWRSIAEPDTTVISEEAWKPEETVVIICDVWNQHWCKGATGRVNEMVGRMNELTEALRNNGALIVHAPSDTMDFYQDTPQRKRAMDAPPATPPVPFTGWCYLRPDYELALPIDDSDGGCDCQPKCKEGKAWESQHPAIRVAPQDAVSDNGQEIYNLMEKHGLKNVIIFGVHTNMCVLGRTFGIRMMCTLGKNVVLVRDLTDTMYNSRMSPFVPHDKGTELVIAHVETYWAPTVTSGDILEDLQ